MAGAELVQALIETYGWLRIVLVLAIDGTGIPAGAGSGSHRLTCNEPTHGLPGAAI